jgi:hypothetical protein
MCEGVIEEEKTAEESEGKQNLDSIEEDTDDDYDDNEDNEIKKKEGKYWQERLALFPYLVLIENKLEELYLLKKQTAANIYNIFALGKRSFFIENQHTNLNAIATFYLTGRKILESENNEQAF